MSSYFLPPLRSRFFYASAAWSLLDKGLCWFRLLSWGVSGLRGSGGDNGTAAPGRDGAGVRCHALWVLCPSPRGVFDCWLLPLGGRARGTPRVPEPTGVSLRGRSPWLLNSQLPVLPHPIWCLRKRGLPLCPPTGRASPSSLGCAQTHASDFYLETQKLSLNFCGHNHTLKVVSLECSGLEKAASRSR